MEAEAFTSLSTHRILVTGATGFVGSWLVDHLLARGAAVTALVFDSDPESPFLRSGLRRRTRCVWGSVENYDLLERVMGEHEIDTVFHLAAISVQGRARQHPRMAFDVNARGTYNVLEACRVHADRIRRVIVASSDKVYGDNGALPYTEVTPLHGRNPYDASKVCADVIAQTYYHSFGLPVAIGRFGNVYGGGDLNWSRLVPNTIRRLLHGQRPVLRRHAGGVFRRDFLYVKDLIGAYSAMFDGLSAPEFHGQAFNFGTGVCWTVADVVHKIQHYVGVDAEPLIIPESEGEIAHQHVSAEKARSLLGWAPSYSLDAGLEETVDWYERFFAQPLTVSMPGFAPLHPHAPAAPGIA